MAEVELVDILKRYGKFQAIHGVSLRIEDGSFVALVGPSGCGKSTLLRMIAGLEDVTGGELQIGGIVMNDVPPKHRDIAMVFQNYALYPHMTVERNIGVPLRLRGVPRAVRREKVLTAARILGLEPLLDRYPRQLSGGQRQRVAMGRAIVRDPQVFLFDEPLSNLDAKLRIQMRTELKELHQRLGTTTVFVTHDQIEAMTLADVVVVMNEGRIEQSGMPLDLYDRPETLFVAEFIGSPSMNLIKGTVRLDGRPRIESDEGFSLALAPDHNAAVGQRVVAGIRPEHLRIDRQGFPFTVSVVEPTGAEIQVTGRASGHAMIALFRERVDLHPKDEIRLSTEPRDLHLFDEKTGSRIIQPTEQGRSRPGPDHVFSASS